MRRICLAVLAATFSLHAAAQAQAPASGLPASAPPAAAAAGTPSPAAGGTPEKVPFGIPYGAPIGLVQARGLLDAALAEAGRHGWPLNIAVVDTHGDLVAFARMDGAMLASIAISQGKARTAARFRRESRVFYNAVETGNPYVTSLDPTLVASPGGVPLIADGKLIGAIGCSGGTGDQDAAVCKAVAASVR